MWLTRREFILMGGLMLLGAAAYRIRSGPPPPPLLPPNLYEGSAGATDFPPAFVLAPQPLGDA